MFATVMQVFKRFPLIFFAQFLFVPVRKFSSLKQMEKATTDSVLRYIERRGSLEHMEYFDFILPDDEPITESKQELTHIGSLALQVIFPNLGPMADWFYGTILFLLDKPEY